MNFIVVFFIIAVAYGRLTGTLHTRELARKSELTNETKPFSVQWDSNKCIPGNRRDKQIDNTVNSFHIYVDTNEPEMTVNIHSDSDGRDLYIGFIDCAGSNNWCPGCEIKVPIINGGVCNHETGERFSGQLTFQYEDWFCGKTIKEYRVRGACFFEIFMCY